jgi:diguanylate cyclase (GGDEF)-like protein
MKILLVDDSRTIAMLTTARLESFGYEVRHAADGATAIAMFQQEPFDLILMDIEMPGMNGFEATTRIRALEGSDAWAWTPIIFVTATDTNANLVTAIEAGGDDFISKTAAENVLQAKMKAMTRIATMRARLAVANNKLHEQANRDGLTGLLNRRALDMKVDQGWEAAVAAGKPFGLLMIDVDNFKKYNDTYGHLSGDDCLRQVAESIASSVQQAAEAGTGPGAIAARYGGEEFCVIVPDAAAGDHVALATRIVEGIAGLAITHEKNGEWGVVTASIGAVCIGPASGRVVQVFRLADELLYKAKAGGRNRVESGCL